MDIKQLIGEATDYDKKLALEERKPKSWCKSISAFANCYGGKLVFGVADESPVRHSRLFCTRWNGLTKASGIMDALDDRIEIYSPGGMVSGISLEGKDLLKIPSKRRNPILADIFSRLKYMERRGSGFKKILADYEEQVAFDKTKEPVFDADNDDFTLTLYNLNYGYDYVMNANDTQGDTQSDTQGDTQGRMEEMIIRMIKKNSKISTADMAKELGVGIATVKRKIKKMSNVTFVGRGYSGHWEIKN